MKSFNLDTTVTVCGGTPQEPINVSNSNDTYVVDTLVDLELPDITVTDSDGTVSTVPSMENVVCTPSGPSSVRVSNSDDSYDVNTSVDLELPDSSVSNSNNSYVNTLPATEDLALPNINFTDSNGVVTSVPSMEDIVATPCSVKSGIAYERFYHNNSSTSVALYDEAWLIQNGVLDGYTQPANPLYTQKLDPLDNTGNTLFHPNAFGNYIRFTYADGTQSNMDGLTYSIDNLTGLAMSGVSTLATFNGYCGAGGAIETFNTNNTEGYNDWFGGTAAIFWRLTGFPGALYWKRTLHWNITTLLAGSSTTRNLYYNGYGYIYFNNMTTNRFFLNVRIHFK